MTTKVDTALCTVDSVGVLPEKSLLRSVVALEGLIAAGKSTICQRMTADYDDINVFDERVSEAFLQLFYSDPAKYAFAFQLKQLELRKYQLALAEHVKATSRAPPHHLNLWDRSMIGDYIFALWNHLSGNISRAEMDVYEAEFGGSLRDVRSIEFLKHFDIILFLDDAPAACKNRAGLRGNESEQGIPLEYFDGLDHVHFAIATKLLEAGEVPVKVLTFGDYNTPGEVLQHIRAGLDGVVGSVVEESEDIVPPKSAHVIDCEASVDVLLGAMAYKDEAIGQRYATPLYIRRDIALVDPSSLGVVADHGYPIRFHKNNYRRLVMRFLRQGGTVHFY